MAALGTRFHGRRMDAVQQLIVLVVAGVATVAIVLALLLLARRERRLVGGRTSQELTAERVRAVAAARDLPAPAVHVPEPAAHVPEPASPPVLRPGPTAPHGLPAAPPRPAAPRPSSSRLAHVPRVAIALSRSAFHRLRRLIASRRLSFGRRTGA